MQIKKNIIIFFFTILLSMSVMSTSAYFINIINIHNIFVLGKEDSLITENFVPPYNIEENITYEQSVKISNSGNVNNYVRVFLKLSDETLNNKVILNGLTEAINSGDWYYNDNDEYYYYTKELKAGETTTNLLNSVTILDNNIELNSFDIIIYEDSVQSDISSLKENTIIKNYKDYWTQCWNVVF